MKILVSVENFNPPLGGAEVSLEGILNELSKKNDIYVLYAGVKKASSLNLVPKPSGFVFKNIPVFNRTVIRQYMANIRWKKYLDSAVKKIRPDVILTQLEYTPSSIDIAKKYGIKSVIFLNNYDHFCPFSFRNGIEPLRWKRHKFLYSPLAYKIQYPFSVPYIKWHEKALRNADLIISASGYMADILKKFYGLDSVVFNQILDLEDFIVNKKLREYISFINPTGIKGADIVFNLAKRLKSKKFLVAEWNDSSWKEKFSSLNNVFWFGKHNIKDVYSKTRILLIPSVWPEILGRVALEAEINGIPCIGSKIGGIPEAIGSGGIIIKNPYDIDSWDDAIRSLDNPSKYNIISRKAKAHAGQFSRKRQMRIFEKMLRDVVS